MNKGFTVFTGALISYFVTRDFPIFFITGVHVLDAPFSVARKDIFFLHHVLELCCYFLPDRAVDLKTFDLVKCVYTDPQLFSSTLRKKLFLFKLLVSFCFYEGHAPLSINMFHYLASESIDSIEQSFLHLEVEKNIDRWLFSCVKAHPKFEEFKTVRFLKNIGCHDKT